MRGRGVLQVGLVGRQAYSHGEGGSGVNEGRETTWDLAAPIMLGCRVSPARLGVGQQAVRVAFGRRCWLSAGGRRQAVARACRWSLRRLWVAVISRHSVRTAPRPRRRKRSRPRLNFIWANTGSIIGWRLR